MSLANYYWILPYIKKLKVFFASDVNQALEKDDIYFSVANIVVAIEYWMREGCIEVLPHQYVSNGHPVKKYVYAKDPE